MGLEIELNTKTTDIYVKINLFPSQVTRTANVFERKPNEFPPKVHPDIIRVGVTGQSRYSVTGGVTVRFYPNTAGPAQRLTGRIGRKVFASGDFAESFSCYLVGFHAVTAFRLPPTRTLRITPDDVVAAYRFKNRRLPRPPSAVREATAPRPVHPGGGTRECKHRRKYSPGFGTIWDRMAWRRRPARGHSSRDETPNGGLLAVHRRDRRDSSAAGRDYDADDISQSSDTVPIHATV